MCGKQWWVVLFVLGLLVAPQVFAGDTWCLRTTDGTCESSATYSLPTAFRDYCVNSGGTNLVGNDPQCKTVCCCYADSVPNHDVVNAQKSNVWIFAAACTKRGSNGRLESSITTDTACLAKCSGPAPSSAPVATASGKITIRIDDVVKPVVAGTKIYVSTAPSTLTSSITPVGGNIGTYTIASVPYGVTTFIVDSGYAGCMQRFSDQSVNVATFSKDFAVVCKTNVATTTTCTPSAPTVSSVSLATDLKSLTVTINPNVAPSCNYVGFGLTKCEVPLGLKVCSPVNVVKKLDGTPIVSAGTTITLPQDQTPEPGKTVCFGAYTGYSNHEQVLSADNSVKCYTAPDPRCIGKANGYSFCGYAPNSATPPLMRPAVMKCDNGQAVVGTACDEKLCLPTETPICVSSFCSSCNGLLGLFSSTTGLKPVLPTGGNVICDGYRVKKDAQACFITPVPMQLSGNYPGITPVFDACSAITSCDKYSEKSSCEADMCGLGIGSSQFCTWRSLNQELGVGVCVRNDKTIAPPCGLCDTSIGFCNKIMCEGIGLDLPGTLLSNGAASPSVCYYDALSNGYSDPYKSRCLSRDQMACRYYDKKEDCEGTGTDAKSVLFDVRYQTPNDASHKAVAGSNTWTQKSNDLLRLNSCMWVTDTADPSNSRCIKNADNWFPESAGNSNVDSRNVIDDCESITGNLHTFNEKCLSDNTPPVTTLVTQENRVYTPSDLKTIPLIVVDTPATAASNLKTYFCLEKQNNRGTVASPVAPPIFATPDCYPSSASLDLAKPAPSELPEGQLSYYRIRYYSTDGNGNFEPIQSAIVLIRGDGIPVFTNAVVTELHEPTPTP